MIKGTFDFFRSGNSTGGCYSTTQQEQSARVIPARMTMTERFYDFAQLQSSFIKKQPLLAAVYAFAGFFFGFTNLFTVNPFTFVRASLATIHGAAIVYQVFSEAGGIRQFISQVMEEFSELRCSAQPHIEILSSATKRCAAPSSTRRCAAPAA